MSDRKPLDYERRDLGGRPPAWPGWFDWLYVLALLCFLGLILFLGFVFLAARAVGW